MDSVLNANNVKDIKCKYKWIEKRRFLPYNNISYVVLCADLNIVLIIKPITA